MAGKLPKGWVETKFEKIISNLSNGIADKQNKNGIGIPVSRIETIAEEKINFCKIGFVDGFCEENLLKYRLSQGDILFSHINSDKHLGKTAIFKEKGKLLYHGTNLLRLQIEQKLTTSKFIHYLCKHFRNLGIFQLHAQHAVNQSSLNQKKIKSLKIPLPPLNEQKRIVAKLDQLLARVDSARARLSSAEQTIKGFRQAVLNAAVTGRLTEVWSLIHPEVKPAKLLLEKIQKEKQNLYKKKLISKPQQIVSKKEAKIGFKLNRNWTSCKFGNILTQISTGPFGSMLHKSDYVKNGIPVINPANIINDGIVPSKKMMISKEKLKELSKYIIYENDLIIARRGDLSKCSLVTIKEAGWLCGTGSFVVKPSINPNFIKIFYKSDHCQKILNQNAIGSTMANLNQKVLSDIDFALPPIEEQKEIVKRVEALFKFADSIEAKLKAARNRTENMTASILAKAFRGELVSQDPNDQPAEELLAEIESLKSAAVPKKGKSNK